MYQFSLHACLFISYDHIHVDVRAYVYPCKTMFVSDYSTSLMSEIYKMLKQDLILSLYLSLSLSLYLSLSNNF